MINKKAVSSALLPVILETNRLVTWFVLALRPAIRPSIPVQKRADTARLPLFMVQPYTLSGALSTGFFSPLSVRVMVSSVCLRSGTFLRTDLNLLY